MFSYLRATARLSAIALSAAALFAISNAAGASVSGQVSNRPSAATPYCVVTFTSHRTLSAEKCASTHAAMTRLIPATSTVISEDFSDASYQGAVLTWTVSGIVSCNGFPNYEAPSMPSGWNDVISSYKDFVRCSNNPHYENNGYTGAVVNCGPNCSYVGNAMNDQTSSEKWGS